jgi:hypothetical protein
MRTKIANMNAYYQRSRGYSLGYNYIISRDGVCWEVRGLDFGNAANTKRNSTSISVQFDVNGQDAATPAQVSRFNQFVRDARKEFGKELDVIGHFQVKPTGCPGEGIKKQLAAGLLNGKDVNPLSAAPASNKPVPPMTLNVSRSRNHRGQDAMWVQRSLLTAGFPPGPLDGWFGRRTEGAAMNFQRANGLYVDGWVGPQTWRVLRAHALAWAEKQ